VTSLLALEVAKGVNLQTNTPVTAVSSAPDSNGFWTATTPRGSIRAKKVVLSTNGYTSALLPQYSGVIVPNKGICSYINVPSTWEGPRFLESVCLTPGNGWDYLIARTDGSFIVGGGYSSFYKDRKKLCENRVDDDTLIEPAAHYFDDYMQRTFTGWEDSGASVGKIWTGSECLPLPWFC
jgi:glycine/D-amino acid oxidase-like deaminating enzyme